MFAAEDLAALMLESPGAGVGVDPLALALDEAFGPGMFDPDEPLGPPPDRANIIAHLTPELQDLWYLEEENAQAIEQKTGRGLRLYMEDAWGVVEPGRKYVDNWHVGYMAEHLAAATNGEIKNLLINIPPRHLKSTIVAVMWPTWEWGPANLPHLRWIFSTYAQTLSTRDSQKRRLIMGSRWYRRWWGDRFKLGKEVPAEEGGRFVSDGTLKYGNDKGGYHLSTSVKGSNTGEGGDRIVVDDPHNMKEIHSEVIRESVVLWWREVMSTRINDPHNYAKVGVMQRGHEGDFSGDWLNSGGVVHICLPTEKDPKPIVYPNALPPLRPDPRTEDGELLCPARMGPEEVAQAKVDLGSYAYSAQHSQRPYPPGGNIFREEWWRYWVTPDHPLAGSADDRELFVIHPSQFKVGCISVDCAFKEEADSDHVAMGAWAKWKGYAVLTDMVSDRMDFRRTLKSFISFTFQWPQFKTRLIEEAANGPALVSMLKHRIPGLISKNVGNKSKLERAYAVQPFCEARNVILPHPQMYGWVDTKFKPVVSSFPTGTRDDEVDMMTQALLRLFGHLAFTSSNFADVDLG